jgi:hypothetical protein
MLLEQGVQHGGVSVCCFLIYTLQTKLICVNNKYRFKTPTKSTIPPAGTTYRIRKPKIINDLFNFLGATMLQRNQKRDTKNPDHLKKAIHFY